MEGGILLGWGDLRMLALEEHQPMEMYLMIQLLEKTMKKLKVN